MDGWFKFKKCKSYHKKLFFSGVSKTDNSCEGEYYYKDLSGKESFNTFIFNVDDDGETMYVSGDYYRTSFEDKKWSFQEFKKENSFTVFYNYENKLGILKFTTAIEINKNNCYAYVNRANIYGMQNKNNEALNDYSSAILIIPNDYRIWFMRANKKCIIKDFKGAIEDYNKTIELSPNFCDAYRNRAIAKESIEDKNKCVDYEKALILKCMDEEQYNKTCK